MDDFSATGITRSRESGPWKVEVCAPFSSLAKSRLDVILPFEIRRNLTISHKILNGGMFLLNAGASGFIPAGLSIPVKPDIMKSHNEIGYKNRYDPIIPSILKPISGRREWQPMNAPNAGCP